MITKDIIDQLVIDDVSHGEFKVHRDIFRKPSIFELEMKYIFEGNWLFVGILSQVANPNDYFLTWLGRHPLIVARDSQGNLVAFINSCTHKGARIAHHEVGNTKHWTCGYHGWVYNTAGECINVKDQGSGCYPPSFDLKDHGLRRVTLSTYRDFIFATLSSDVVALDEHLGEARLLLDLISDQSPDGIELIPGVSKYTFNANWKMQIDNTADGYHFTSCHPSYMNVLKRRKKGESNNRQVRALDFSAVTDARRGYYTLNRGHVFSFGYNPMPEERGLYRHHEELVKRVGDYKAQLMYGIRNLTIYPNVQFAENFSLQLRIIRPLAVDRTEMFVYCVGAKGECDEAREIRIRQYEDFFNASGLATPDDLAAYEDCQFGYRAEDLSDLQAFYRGMTNVMDGADDFVGEIGVSPLTSLSGNFEIQDETVMHGFYRAWKQLLKDGLEREPKWQ